MSTAANTAGLAHTSTAVDAMLAALATGLAKSSYPSSPSEDLLAEVARAYDHPIELTVISTVSLIGDPTTGNLRLQRIGGIGGSYAGGIGVPNTGGAGGGGFDTVGSGGAGGSGVVWVQWVAPADPTPTPSPTPSTPASNSRGGTTTTASATSGTASASKAGVVRAAVTTTRAGAGVHPHGWDHHQHERWHGDPLAPGPAPGRGHRLIQPG